MPKEIERKFLVNRLCPVDIEKARSSMKMGGKANGYDFRIIEQAYLTTDPVIRVRRDNKDHYLTYKGEGLLEREEYDLPLTKEAYESLKAKADGNIIRKKRVLIPLDDGHTVELDIFAEPFDDLTVAEVEFSSLEESKDFKAPDWFDEEVTGDKSYSNSSLSRERF